jgi:calcineurin-like phosphoesterase
LLPQGTAYVTDVGMVGATDSIIGNKVEAVLERFLTGLPTRLPVANGPVTFNSVLAEVDENSGRATNIFRLDRVAE